LTEFLPRPLFPSNLLVDLKALRKKPSGSLYKCSQKGKWIMEKKLPRHKRTKDFQRIVLQRRDVDIVLGVYENRFLRRDQIERLFFNNTSTCNQRLQKLYQHKFLDRIYQPIDFGSSQAIYALDSVGAEVVAAKLGVGKRQINWTRRHNKIEHLFLDHTLGVAEARVGLEMALRYRKDDDVKLLFWKREAFLPREKVQDPYDPEKKLSVIPDAFFGLQTDRGKLYFFIEVDMGTETLERFRTKIVAYREYWRSGKFQSRYTYRNFRVLTITNGVKRLNNLIDTADNSGAKNMLLFTVDKLASSDFLNSWYKPQSLDPINILD
jgi:hypothetical protein